MNVFTYQKSLVYATTLSEPQWGMLWQLIIEEFGPNIQHITGFDKILADTLSKLTYTSVDKYATSTSKAQCHTNKIFTIGREEKW